MKTRAHSSTSFSFPARAASIRTSNGTLVSRKLGTKKILVILYIYIRRDYYSLNDKNVEKVKVYDKYLYIILAIKADFSKTYILKNIYRKSNNNRIITSIISHRFYIFIRRFIFTNKETKI